MAGYKITKKDAYYTYEAPGHKECKLCRLHDPQDIDGGRLISSVFPAFQVAWRHVVIWRQCRAPSTNVSLNRYSKATVLEIKRSKQVTAAYIPAHTPKNALQISVQQPLRC